MDGSRNGRKSSSMSIESGLLGAYQRFTKKTHAFDYLGFVLLMVGYALLKLFAEPFHSQFRLDDPRIQHPFAEHERVPVAPLFIYAMAIPAAALVAWSLVLRPDLHKTHVTLLGLVISIMTTLFLTDLFKDAIGRPRPDLIARCIPNLDTPKSSMISVESCTQEDPHKLQDGWRSYPSGHSSFAFAGLGWLALVLASQTHVLRPRANMVTVLVCLIPLLGAALIAISRLEDYRHDVFDVVSGSVLGFSISYFNWRRYYPSLHSNNCHEPYPVNSNGRSSPTGFQRIRDEEENYVDRHRPDDEGDHC